MPQAANAANYKGRELQKPPLAKTATCKGRELQAAWEA
jgi:hypothetical protein